MKRLLNYLIVLSGVFALIAQYYLILQNPEVTALESTIRFATYFTILTNTLVLVYFVTLLLAPSHRWRVRAESVGVSAAVTLYIAVVGLVYQVALRHIWEPTGLQRIVDELLHTFIPLFAVIYWLVFAPKRGLHWNMLPAWLVYPFLYVVIVMVRGLTSGWYPYYFINVYTLGWSQVIINAVVIVAVFCVIGSLMILFARGKK